MVPANVTPLTTANKTTDKKYNPASVNPPTISNSNVATAIMDPIPNIIQKMIPNIV